MLGELFTPIETPEAQNRGFLKGFFGGNANTFDREELCVFSILLFHLYYWVLYKLVVEHVICFFYICHFFKNCLQLVRRQQGKLLVVLPSTSQGRLGWKV